MLGGQVKKEAKYMGNAGECWPGPIDCRENRMQVAVETMDKITEGERIARKDQGQVQDPWDKQH